MVQKEEWGDSKQVGAKPFRKKKKPTKNKNTHAKRRKKWGRNFNVTCRAKKGLQRNKRHFKERGRAEKTQDKTLVKRTGTGETRN